MELCTPRAYLSSRSRFQIGYRSDNFALTGRSFPLSFRYPFEPPNVKFITPVYHPNIDSGGRICHDILNMPPKGQWRPSLNIGAVLASIRVLLEEPNHDDGLMSDISAEYKHNRALFDDKARRCTERYAVQNSTERNVVSCRDTHQGQSSEAVSQDGLARPVLNGVDSIGASKVTLDEPSTRASGEATANITQVKPRQNFAAKLSLAKGCTTQGSRLCGIGGAREAEPINSSSFISEKDKVRETDTKCDPVGKDVSQAELNGGSVSKVDIRKLEGVPTINALMETDGVRLDTKAADYTRKDIASCSVTKDNQANAEISVSQSSQRTSIADTGKRLMLPKTKLLKLSRPVSMASQNDQVSTQSGGILQSSDQPREVTKVSNEPIIIIDSESDDENYRVQVRSEGVKRKHGCA
ncbi:uncharacterized protein [Physcomitrium patens]|uniref:uncharacterized protein isoform X2 n=1 Tax=Physcomitrium patens TaxID=3218 RepID=UPI000D1696BF|nr:uncharacterized protein LOC112275966 isoform X2 [Physcomitrium patens]|eukprot:XP_024362595.1 uncharacterized protein LOC112275966 isoform X2 [Physcomitrella patens]